MQLLLLKEPIIIKTSLTQKRNCFEEKTQKEILEHHLIH
jgi:hypothetical protein